MARVPDRSLATAWMPLRTKVGRAACTVPDEAAGKISALEQRLLGRGVDCGN